MQPQNNQQPELPTEVAKALRALTFEVHPDIVEHLTKTIEQGFAQAIQSAKEEERRQIMKESGAVFVNWNEALSQEGE